MTPADKLLQKTLVTSGIPSSEWSRIHAGLRDRAFFSSRVESLRFLAEARQRVADQLAGTVRRPDGALATRASTISGIADAGKREGISTGKGGLTDPGSIARAKVIADTNGGLAAGYVRREASMTDGARAAFPAQELIRVRPSKQPRDWKTKWQRAGGQLFDERMIARIDDPIWIKISAFGQPYPPFDFGSGMGVRAIGRSAAIRLGVIPADYKPQPRPASSSFNDNLTAEIPVGGWDIDDLRAFFGDQVVIRQRADGTMTASWRGKKKSNGNQRQNNRR